MRSPLRPAVLLAGALLAAVPAAAQGPPHCRTGRPAPECGTFPVATFHYFPGSRATSDSEIPFKRVEWDFGWMMNRGPVDAVGASLAVGTGDTGFHAAVKGRYRRWVGSDLALDADAGLLIAQHPPRVYPHETLTGVTAGVAVGWTDWIAVSGQARMLWGASDGEPVTSAELGVRLGTLPGAIATLLGGAYLAASVRGGV